MLAEAGAGAAGAAAPGDLLAASAVDHRGRRWLLASFHGDSAGRSAAPLVAAVDALARGPLAGHVLLLGIDANTRSDPPPPPPAPPPAGLSSPPPHPLAPAADAPAGGGAVTVAGTRARPAGGEHWHGIIGKP